MFLTIGYDDNLGFPADFTQNNPCQLQPYHELDEMVADFEQERLWAIFTPAGTLPYLRGGAVVAQARGEPFMSSQLVSTEVLNLDEVRSRIFGRINRYCTTSFWAPMMALMPYFPSRTVLQFKETNGFYDLLKQAAESRVDCAMVWSRILHQYPEEALKIRSLIIQNNLPLPVIYARLNGSHFQNLIARLKCFVSTDKQFFFKGFQEPNKGLLNEFLNKAQKAQGHFKVNC